MARLDDGAQSSGQADSLARVDLGALAVAAGSALRLQRPDPDVRVGDETGGITVTGIADECRRALTNLIDNAGTATPSGGVVGVHASLDAGRLVVAVIDSGPGVPEFERARIFDRFVRGDDARIGAGSGLGLTIARRHGGDVILAPGASASGAPFDLWLPAPVSAVPARNPVRPADEPVSSLRSR